MNRKETGKKPVRPTFFLALVLVAISIFFFFPIGYDSLSAEVNVIDESLSQCDPFAKKPAKKKKLSLSQKKEENIALNKKCAQCHKKVINELASYSFQHSYIVAQSCNICHIPEEPKTNAFSRNTKSEKRKRFTKIMGQEFNKEFLVPVSHLTNTNKGCFRVSLTNKHGKNTQSDFYSIDPDKVSPFETTDSPPIISGVKVTNLRPGIFEVSWKTDKFSNSVVHYGTSKDYGETASNMNLVRDHKVILDKLDLGIEYHFQVFSIDISEKIGKTEDNTFLAKKEITDSPPIISDIKVMDLQPGVIETITVSWKTDIFSNSVVHYGTSKNYGEIGSNSKLVKKHKVILDSLTHGVEYHFQVFSSNNSDNTGKSEDNIFFTQEDKVEKSKTVNLTEPPKIGELRTFSASTDEVFLYITSSLMARYRIDYVLLKPPDTEKSENTIENLEGLPHGETSLTTGEELGTKSCIRCHGLNASHPVNAIARGIGTRIDLPLVNNRLTCITCHTSHGGEVGFLLRLKESDLCSKCHTF